MVRRTSIPHAEARAFEDFIRASGRDPAGFRARMFETGEQGSTTTRRVQVATRHATVQYDASDGAAWTESFARHLARGFFGT